MLFDNGVRAVYEGSVSNAVGLNTFYQEYIRVDGENGTAILNHRDVEVFMRQDIWRQQHREGQGQKIALLTQPKWINHWLIEQFAQWRDGGPPMETRVEENVQASALVFAAIESQRTGTAGRRAGIHRVVRARPRRHEQQQRQECTWKRETSDAPDCASRWSVSAATISAGASTSTRPGASCTARSMPASRCSTPPTTTAIAAARRSQLGEMLGDRRKDIVLATKFGLADGRRGGNSRARRAATS